MRKSSIMVATFVLVFGISANYALANGLIAQAVKYAVAQSAGAVLSKAGGMIGQVAGAAADRASESISPYGSEFGKVDIKSKNTAGSITTKENAVIEMGTSNIGASNIKKLEIRHDGRVGSLYADKEAYIGLGGANIHGTKAEEIKIRTTTRISGRVSAGKGSVIRVSMVNLY